MTAERGLIQRATARAGASHLVCDPSGGYRSGARPVCEEVSRRTYPFDAPASAISTSVAWVTPVAPREAYGYALRK